MNRSYMYIYRSNVLQIQIPKRADEWLSFSFSLSFSIMSLYKSYACNYLGLSVRHIKTETYKWTATASHTHTQTHIVDQSDTLCQTIPWMKWIRMVFDLALLNETNWFQLFIDVPQDQSTNRHNSQARVVVFMYFVSF